MNRVGQIIGVVIGLGIAAAAGAAAPVLKSVRFGGTSYVAVTDVAQYYALGRNLSKSEERATFRTNVTELSFDADQRDVQLNGVRHWLSAPILAERDRLWVSSVDLLKAIDPVLRGGRTREPALVRTIVIDPGHGGTDRGARGVAGIEKEMTLDVARRLERRLEAEGLRVVLTRRSDRPLSLEERVDLVKAQRADLFVSVHFNSGGSADGIETYCLPPAGAVSTANPFRRFFGGEEMLPGNRFDERNVWLAHCVQKSLVQAMAANDRGVRRARFYVLRDVRCPSILVECGFLSNRAEEKKLVTSEYRERLAKAIAEGILKYRVTPE